MTKKKLHEAPPIEYSGEERMSPDIERKIKAGEHPLAGSPAFPDVDKDGIPDNFEELIASKRFQDVIQRVKDATGLETIDPQSAMSLQPMLQQAFIKTLQIESQHKEELERLAVKLIRDEMGIPEEDLQFKAELKKPTLEGMSPKPQKPKKPEFDFSNPEAELEAADKLEKFNLERQKRRFINSLIQGSAKKALYMYHLINEKLNEIDPDLVNLYSLLMSVNDLMYWILPDMDVKMASGEGEELGAGREELDLETDPPTIKAEGALFPILVHELFKGVMEYVSAHGLPSDPGTAEAVIGMEDTLPAEVWDLRLGPIIWEKFSEAYPSSLYDKEDRKRIQNYLYFRLVSLPAEEFMKIAKEMLSGSDAGKKLIQKMVDDIITELQQEDYDESLDSDETEDDIMSIVGDVMSEPLPPESEDIEELDLDTILDKISKLGMSSLTPAEKSFLMNYGS